MSLHSWVQPDNMTASSPKRVISTAQAVSAFALAIDAVLIIAVSVASGRVFHLIAYDANGDTENFFATGVITAILFCSFLRIWGTKYTAYGSSGFNRIRNGIIAWCITFIILLVLAFTMKVSAVFSRGTIFSFFGAGLIAVSLSRFFVPRWLANVSFANAYRGLEPLIFAPSQDRARPLQMALSQLGCEKANVYEFVDQISTSDWPRQIRQLAQRIFDIARTAAPGEVYILPGQLSPSALEALLQRLHILPRAVFLVPDAQLASLLRYTVRPVGQHPVLEMQKAPMTRLERALKRVLDITISGSSLLLFLPLMALIAIAIKLDSPGPALFVQTRNGYRGTPFRILKFRSMRVMEDGAVVTQASKQDSRITRLGRLLRKSSLDELPQLINVLSGDMSIVGPRPHAIAHDRLYSSLIDDYEVRQHVRPGITGWAQVNGLRGETAHVDLMYRRIEMDIWYATHCSLGLDVQIILRTFIEVLRQRNAY